MSSPLSNASRSSYRESVPAFLIRSAILLCALPLHGQTDAAARKAQQARDLVIAGKPGEAVPIYRELVREFPSNAVIRVNLCVAEFQAQQYREAMADAEEALRLQPGLPAAELFLGASRLELGDSAGAVEPLERAARAQPMDRNAAAFLAEALLGAGLPDKAVGQFRRAAEMAPEDPRVWYGLGRSYEKLSDSAQAQQAWERLMQLPPSRESYMHLAEVKEHAGEYVEAAKRWREALGIAPNDPHVEGGLVWALYKARDYQAAIPVIDRLLLKNPQSAELNFLRGACQVNLEEPETGLPYLEKAVALDAGFVPARAALGQALLRTGKPKEAIPHLRAALETDPDGSVHFQLYRAWQMAGKADEARKALAEYRSFTSAALK